MYGFKFTIFNKSIITKKTIPPKKPKKKNKNKEKYIFNFSKFNFEITKKNNKQLKLINKIIIASNPAFFSNGASLLKTKI